MPNIRLEGYEFDARPDRIDYRDRPYQPPLVSLPEEYPEPEFIAKNFADYSAQKLILDQGKEGACTGFGLAAMINYLLWRQAFEEGGTAVKVSTRMLYEMARIYDEWPGEDYDGSSCRGAMKGWHRHGVCRDTLWPYRGKRHVRPKQGWQQDAARRPLGAYYRINKDSIADMQAAIHEVGAIYVSAAVHKGWFLDATPQLEVIKQEPGETGGHAFALVGYTSQGFIVQNSWGETWGYHGFAVLSYADWVQHGADAWVAVLGAPVQLATAARTYSTARLRDVAVGKAEWFWRSDRIRAPYEYKNPAVQPLSESDAYEHSVVLGNNGRPLNRFLDVRDARAAVREACLTLPKAWLAGRAAPKLAVYAHGGLNDEAASVNRIRVMAPYFIENEIYPLFFTWRTGFLESIRGMLDDVVGRFFSPAGELPARGALADALEKLKDQLSEARDRTIEVASEQILVKSVWREMKQNAEAAAGAGGGLALAAAALGNLKKAIPNLEVHLVGHSAGSILHGHFLGKLRRKVKVSTATLYAPACTVAFANRHYGGAIKANVLAKRQLHVDLLTDARERADSVGPYGKSLLYLVSRALEDVHKTPLLGMQRAWKGDLEADDLWNDGTLKDIRAWRRFTGTAVHLREFGEPGMVSDGQGMIPLAHGSFDNDVAVVAETIRRIRGKRLRAEVENLRGF